MSFENQHATFY